MLMSISFNYYVKPQNFQGILLLVHFHNSICKKLSLNMFLCLHNYHDANVLPLNSKPAKTESSTELKKDSTVNKKLKPKPQSPEG